MPQRPDDTGRQGLTRERLVEAALGLVGEAGLDALSMRALADRLDVKAASIYWHVRDRGELMELLAESILGSAPRPRAPGGWRAAVTATTEAFAGHVAAHKDAGRILIETPAALTAAGTFGDLKAQLVSAGLERGEATDVAVMLMTYAISGQGAATRPEVMAEGAPARLAIDTGSRGVLIRAGGADMETLVRLPPDRAAAAPAVIRGEQVIVRRLRGVGRGELELNPRRSWSLRVQAPTWNTLLELGGIDVRDIHLDSGAAKVEIFLPRPRGVVPIDISGGTAGTVIHRPRGAAAVVDMSPGAVQVRLDDFSTRATTFDTHWETPNASASADRFALRISGGAVKIRLDEYELSGDRPAAAEVEPARGTLATALDIVLDGVQARVAARRR